MRSVLFGCLIVLPLIALEPPPVAEEIVDAPYQPDYAKGLPERHLWKQMRDSFLKHKYRAILKKHGITLSCASCSAVYLDVAFSVDFAGTAKLHTVEAAKACGRPFPEEMKKEFLHFLKIYPYPTPLRGTSVRLRLGSGLSC